MIEISDLNTDPEWIWFTHRSSSGFTEIRIRRNINGVHYGHIAALLRDCDGGGFDMLVHDSTRGSLIAESIVPAGHFADAETAVAAVKLFYQNALSQIGAEMSRIAENDRWLASLDVLRIAARNGDNEAVARLAKDGVQVVLDRDAHGREVAREIIAVNGALTLAPIPAR